MERSEVIYKLFSYRRILQRIEEMEYEIEDLYWSVMPSAIRYDKEKIQVSKDSDSNANTIAEIADKKRMLNGLVEDAEKEREWLVDIISSTTSEDILYLKYVRGKTLYQISREYKIPYDTVKKNHARAINQIQF